MTHHTPTVLYVDDDPDFLDATRAVIESGGYTMLAAGTAEEGLRLFRSEKPDLIFVDLMMEEVDSGTSLVRDLRAHGTTVPIYMLSSVGDNLSGMVDPAALGLEAVLQKPVGREALLGILRSKLG